MDVDIGINIDIIDTNTDKDVGIDKDMHKHTMHHGSLTFRKARPRLSCNVETEGDSPTPFVPHKPLYASLKFQHSPGPDTTTKLAVANYCCYCSVCGYGSGQSHVLALLRRNVTLVFLLLTMPLASTTSGAR